MNEDIKISLVKYITGQADETESAEMKEWIRSNPENEQYYFELYEAWHNSLYASNDLIDADSAYELFLEKTRRKRTLLKKLLSWSKVAAAALVVFTLALGVYKYSTQKPAELLVELSVPNGVTKKMILMDGSTVWINAGSKITYSKDFGTTNRTIYLEGEAYFDIAKSDTDIPFLVKANNFIIRDVGTVFNVKSYPSENIFETTVVEGKVSVEGKLIQGSDQESKVFLDANQVLKINTASEEVASNSKTPIQIQEPVKVLQIGSSQIDEYNGWKDDLLVFKGHTFEEITRILERRYDVDILFENEELKNYKYTGTFKNIDNISKVFQVIKENTPIKYKAEGRLITINNTTN